MVGEGELTGRKREKSRGKYETKGNKLEGKLMEREGRERVKLGE